MDILIPSLDFDFDANFRLSPAIQEKSGIGFSKLVGLKNKPIYIETPKSGIKDAIKSGKIDLLFDTNDSIFLDWLEKLESFCQTTFSKNNQEDGWGIEEVEGLWSSSIFVYQSGKYYRIRVPVPNTSYFYHENKIFDKETLNKTHSLISILEIRGLKISPSNIRLDIILKQALIVPPDPFLEKCFIRANNKLQQQITDPSKIKEPPIEEPPIIEPPIEEPPIIEPPIEEPTIIEETPPIIEETSSKIEETPPIIEETSSKIEETPPIIETSSSFTDEFDLENCLKVRCQTIPWNVKTISFNLETEVEDLFRKIQKKHENFGKWFGNANLLKLNQIKQELLTLLIINKDKDELALSDLEIEEI